MSVHAYLPLLRQGSWFNALPESLNHALINSAQVQQIASGQRLFSRGDQPCGLYALLDGTIGVGAVDTRGKQALLTLVEAPNWFGEISLFDGLPRTHDAVAEAPSRVLLVPQHALLALLAEHPEYWRDMALLMSHKLRLAFIALEDMSLLPAAKRLAHRLLLMAHNYGGGQPRHVLHLAQEQLASMLALSRQTTNQILKDLEAQGILRLTYAEIEILDLPRLQLAAD